MKSSKVKNNNNKTHALELLSYARARLLSAVVTLNIILHEYTEFLASKPPYPKLLGGIMSDSIVLCVNRFQLDTELLKLPKYIASVNKYRSD